jgi:hypothetical protein
VEYPVITVVILTETEDTSLPWQSEATGWAPMISNGTKMRGNEFGAKPFTSNAIKFNNPINVIGRTIILEEKGQPFQEKGLEVKMRLNGTHVLHNGSLTECFRFHRPGKRT